MGFALVIELLLKKGARHDIQDHKGATALLVAAGRGHKVTVRKLKQEGKRETRRARDGEIVKSAYTISQSMDARIEGTSSVFPMFLDEGKKMPTSPQKLWGIGCYSLEQSYRRI